MSYPLGIQLYSLSREFNTDAEAALRSVPQLGFGAVETAGTYGWSLEKWQSLLAETKLVVLGAHIGIDDLEKDLAGQIAFQKGVKNTRVIIPWLAEAFRTTDGYKKAAKRINVLAKEFHAAGIETLYHNHNFEFEKIAEGSFGLEVLMKETDPKLVKFEVDTYWVERGGLNSREFIVSHASRIGMIHAKELRKKDNADVPAGQGDVDFKTLLPLAKKNNWPVIVEFEGENAPAAVAASAKYLKTL